MAARRRVPPVIQDLFHRADERLLAGWYHALSVPTARVRQRLRREHRPFVDPEAPEIPSLTEVDTTASWVIDQARFGASTLGGLAGLGGLASVPPEVLATVVAVLRLGQRLTIVYGFDPETDRGKMVLWRALAAGFEIDLPDRGIVGMRMRDLPAVVTPGSAARTVGGTLATRMVSRAAAMVLGRVTRVLPVLAAGAAAVDGRARMATVGVRMQAVLRHAAAVPASVAPEIEEAVEV